MFPSHDQGGIDCSAIYKTQALAGATPVGTYTINAAPWTSHTIVIKRSGATSSGGGGGSTGEGEGVGPFSIGDTGNGYGYKLTLPVNASNVLSGDNDALEILPSTYAGWNPGDPDMLTYENATYFIRNVNYYEFRSPLYGAYTATAEAARCEFRHLKNYGVTETMSHQFSFSVEQIANNAKLNIGQIHRREGDPVFKLSYTGKDNGTVTDRDWET